MGWHAGCRHMKRKTQPAVRGCGFSQLQRELGSGCKLHVRHGAWLLPARQPKGRVLHFPPPAPVLTLSSTLPRTALPAGGRHTWPPRLRGGLSEAPRMKLGVPARRCTLCFAVLGAKCSGMCDEGARPMCGGGWGCPPLPLASSGRPVGVNGRLYAPVPAGSRAVETAHGQNPLANKTVLFAVGEQEFRGVVWQEARTLAYWKRVCPGAHLMFFPLLPC